MKRTLITALLFVSTFAAAQQRQDPAVIKALAEQYLHRQTMGLPGVVSVKVGELDQRTFLAACATVPDVAMPPGAKPWGKTTVQMSCAAPVAWKVYIQAQVSVLSSYVASAAPLAQGQPVEQSQVVLLQGDIAALPNGVATELSQVIGKSPTISLPAGAPLRLDNLKGKPVVQQGQLVRLTTSGSGFRVSAEAKAIGTAADGQVVQVRTPNGTIVSGVAKPGGLVEVSY